MDIGIHGVKKVMVDKVRRMMSGPTFIRNLHVVTAAGRIDITLFADSADKLEIKQVEDINAFYETEPAS